MDLTKEEFTVLWHVAKTWKNDPKKMSDSTSQPIERYNEIFNKLSNMGFLKLQVRWDKIYGASATPIVDNVLADEKYKDWVPKQ